MIYSKDNLRQIFQQPFNANEWQQMLHHYFQATELRAEPERIDGTPENDQGFYLGAIDTTDSYRIGLFYYQIQHGNVARKRVGLRNLVKSFVNPNWGEFDAALVVFDSGELWRLSFVSDIKGESTAPKRYTYVFGEGESFYNTPVGRFDALQRKGISFENIKDAFSVEALSKEFFDEYREHYADIVEYITGKRYVKEKGKWVEKTIHEPCHEIFNQFVAVYKDPEKTVRDYIKKLMGRLVFLQFLQKKEWMGVPADRQDWKGGDTRFLQNKFNEFPDKDNFIDGFLEPLFNDLNTNRQNNNDLASPKVGSDIKIPFLNGGLFQLDEEDCSNIHLPQHLLGDVLAFFERYNFTIDENDPNDAQIGVDPEMLGRVFENLLEDNKDKGAFYTPKEIVQYMCQESLIAYLQTGIDDESHKESIRQFVLTHEAEHLGSMAEDISIKLLNVKICDPAIGSGAFPMGLLRQLYLCQCAIHPELEEKNAADIKRHIIQNNIYGVDIEKGAVDIARLRFWLSLIVDEETPQFLPNLDFKIMQGNSLLEQYKGVDLSKMTTLSTEQGEGTQLTWFDNMLDVLRLDLRKKLDEYYNCADHQRKELLKKEIIDNVKQQLREQSINVDFGDLDLSANDQFTLWHTWFYDVFSQGGFDIVIANPPYVTVGSNEKSKYQRLYSIIEGHVDLYELFIEGGIRLLKDSGTLVYINPNTVLSNLYSKKLRYKMVYEYGLSEIVNFGMDVFDAVVHTCILRMQKGRTITQIGIKKNISDVSELILPVDYSLIVTDIEKTQNFTFDISFNNSERHMFAKLRGLQTLGDYCFLRQCIKTGNDKDFVMMSDTELPKPWKRTLRGKGIDRFIIKENNVYIKYGDWLARNWKNTSFYECPKIAIREAGDKITACIDLENRYFLSSLYAIYPQKHYTINELKALLAVLNSTFATYFVRKIAFDLTQGAFTKMRTNQLARLPLPSISGGNQEYLANLVDIIISAKQSGIDTISDEMEIDLLVYHLYGLTYDEVLIVDPDTPITRDEYEQI